MERSPLQRKLRETHGPTEKLDAAACRPQSLYWGKAFEQNRENPKTRSMDQNKSKVNGVELFAWRALPFAVTANIIVFLIYYGLSLHLFMSEDMVDWIYAALTTETAMSEIFQPHNGQRIPFTKSLAALSVAFFQARPGFILFVSATALSTTIALIVQAARRSQPSRSLANLATAIALILALRTYTLFAWVHPTYVQYSLAVLFFCLALQAAIRSALKSKGSGVYWVAALLLASCSTYSSGQGILVWPALGWLSFRYRVGPARILLLAAAFGTTAFFYFNGNGLESQQLQSTPSIDKLLLTIHYLGQPWVKVDALYPIGFLTALIVAGAAFWVLVVYGLRTPRPGPHDAFLLSVIGFGVASAILTGLTRASEGTLAVTRYGLFVGLTEAALAPFALKALQPYWRSSKVRKVCLLAGLSVIVLLVTEQIAVGLRVVQKAQVVDHAAQEIRAGNTDPELLRTLHPRPDSFRRTLEEARRQGLSP